MNLSKKVYNSLIFIVAMLLSVASGFALAGSHGQRALSDNKVNDIKEAVSEKNYIIGPGDVLNISVWKNADLSVTVPVRPDGKISSPLVDDISAGGLTPEALAAGITVKLAEFIRDPRVTVIVAKVNSTEYLSRVRVTGAVRNPMSLPFRPGMTVLDVVLVAGGLTEFASPNKSKLFRRQGQETKIYKLKVKDILNKGKLDTNFSLQPGDIITIPERLL